MGVASGPGYNSWEVGNYMLMDEKRLEKLV